MGFWGIFEFFLLKSEIKKGDGMRHQELSLEQIIEQVRVNIFFSQMIFASMAREDGELAPDRLYWVSDYPDVVKTWCLPDSDGARSAAGVYYGAVDWSSCSRTWGKTRC